MKIENDLEETEVLKEKNNPVDNAKEITKATSSTPIQGRVVIGPIKK
jgi:hypothetical protein